VHRLPQSGPDTLTFQYNTGVNSISGSGNFNFDPYLLKPDEKQYNKSMYPPPKATKTVPIRIDFYKNSKGITVAHLNHISMEMFSNTNWSYVPLVDRIARGQELPASNNKTNMNIGTYNTTDVVELIIDNYNEMEHPLHFHGR
jgi:Multicopper oxidase